MQSEAYGTARGRFLRRVALGSLALALAAPVAVAQSDAGDTRTVEARERFDRGLKLVNQNDYGGALAEFLRAYELSPHPVVLFNIGLVYSAMGDSVRAVETLDRLLAAPGGLDARRLERARAERAAQALRIAEIELVANVAGATVDVDGLPAGTTPLPAPLRIPSGQHIIAVVAKGHLPSRRTVTVAGGTKSKLELTLEPQAGDAALLELKTRLPGADVLVDGQVVGRTPLAAPLAVAPGDRRIELTRAGYVTAAQSVRLPPGGRGSIELEPPVDPSALARDGGTLKLAISEEDAVVFVNDTPRGPYAGSFRLPPGKHRIRVERAGFFPFEREVQVPARGLASVPIELEPTPEKRADYVGSARGRRTASLITIGVGGVVTLASGGFLIYNFSEEGSAKDRFDELEAANTPGSGAECDPRGAAPATCLKDLQLSLDKLKDIRAREKFGWVGLGVGVVTTGIGVALLLTGDDPNRYEPRPESDVFGGLPIPSGWVGPDGGGFSLRGSF